MGMQVVREMRKADRHFRRFRRLSKQIFSGPSPERCLHALGPRR